MSKAIRSLGVTLAILPVMAVVCQGTCWGEPAGRSAQQRMAPKRHPDIAKIEKALERVEKNRKAVLAVSRAVVSRANRSLALAFPDVCKTPATASPISIPYPNISSLKDTTSGSKTAKLASRAVSVQKESDLKKTEGDEVGTAVKKLDTKVGKIMDVRALTSDEERLFRKEWMDLIEQVRRIERSLEKDIEDLEEILEAAKKELGIKPPLAVPEGERP